MIRQNLNSFSKTFPYSSTSFFGSMFLSSAMFVQATRQSLQVSIHFRPFFLHLHKIEPHLFLDVLQLQRITVATNWFQNIPTPLPFPMVWVKTTINVKFECFNHFQVDTKRVEICSSLCGWKGCWLQFFAIDYCCLIPSQMSWAGQVLWIFSPILTLN